MNLVNFIFWAIIYRVVYNFTLLHKMNWVAVFISSHYTLSYLTNSLLKLEIVSAATKFIPNRTSNQQLVVKISDKNSKA